MEDIVTSTEEGKKQWLASMAEMKAAWEEIKTSAMSGDSINTINDALRETVDILKENRDVIGGLIKDFAELTAMAAKATASAGSFIARQARDLSLQTQLAIANIRGLFTSDKNAWANNVTKANIIKQMYPEAESVKAGAMISKMPKYQMPVQTLSPVIVRDSQFGPFAGGYRGAKITESPLPNMPGGMQGPEMAQTFTTGWRVAMGQITEDFNQTFGSMVALGREKRVADLLFNLNTYPAANRATLSGTSQWSDFANSDPYTAIMNAMDGMLMRPNTLVMGRQVWSRLRVHPKITAALAPSAIGNTPTANALGSPATTQAVAQLLEVSAIYVGDAWINTAKPGQTSTLTRLWGKHVAMLHQNPAASIRGNAVTFGFSAEWGNRVAGRIAEPKVGLRGGQRVRVGESVRELVVSSDVGYYFQNAVA
jgi:hypothetical protein